MTGHINRLIMRLHTAATEALPMNDAASWTIQRGLGGLEQISITKIANPFPVVKSSPVDVPCANGALDMAEADGVVYYKNKTVEIVMQTLSLQKPWFSALRDAFAPLNGRMVDFAFDLPTEAEWYYTGRLTIDQCDESTGTLGLKIDTYPFLHSSQLNGKGTNYMGVNIPEMDECLDKARSALDAETRNANYARVCEIVRDESIYVPCYTGKRTVAAVAGLKGVFADPMQRYYVYNYEW